MKITNKHNLDESIYNTLSRVYPPVPNRYSVTDLVNPPLMRYLREKHWNELEQDASDMLWMLLGNSVHYALEKGAPSDALSEEKITIELGNVTIAMRVDLWHKGIVKDYKITSVYSFLLGDKPEWETQLNLYGWGYQLKEREVKGLEVLAILRDWQKNKTIEKDYPKIPFITNKIPQWPIKKAEEYAVNWIKNIESPPICSNEEKWTKPTTWAVMKKGKKRAVRVLGSEEEAYEYMGAKKPSDEKWDIQERPGEFTRCKKYCFVKDVCPFNIYKLKNEI